MTAGRETAAAREERAEIDLLRHEADRAAAEAARTLAELTARFTPRSVAARLGGKRAVRLATAVLPAAVVLAATVVVAAALARRRPGRA